MCAELELVAAAIRRVLMRGGVTCEVQVMRRMGWLLRWTVLLATIAGAMHRPVSTAQTREAMPPLLYTCPHHPDQLHDKPGTCPACKLDLEPVRIEAEPWYSCPRHPVVLQAAGGQCPIDRRPLMPVVVTLHWTCATDRSHKFMEPGRCADGTVRREAREIRAHGEQPAPRGTLVHGQRSVAPLRRHLSEGPPLPRISVRQTSRNRSMRAAPVRVSCSAKM
jgi:hypothetical protein